MVVDSTTTDGVVLWERSEGRGIACRSYVLDGTQARIIHALKHALEQAEGEMLAFNVADRILDVSGPAS